jgi:hypothetical protein
MKQGLWALGVLAAGCAVGSAAPTAATPVSTLEPAFKGTIVSTYPDGRTARLWLAPDGTYRGEGRRKKPSSGQWTLKGEEICLRQSKPFPAPISYCTPLVTGSTSWSGRAVTGEPIKITLLPGR